MSATTSRTTAVLLESAGSPPRTSTSIGVSTPVPTPPSRSFCRLSKAGPLRASEAELAEPNWIQVTGAITTASPARATAAATQRNRTMVRAQAVQAREAVFSVRIRGTSIRGPIAASIAGSRVSMSGPTPLARPTRPLPGDVRA